MFEKNKNNIPPQSSTIPIISVTIYPLKIKKHDSKATIRNYIFKR